MHRCALEINSICHEILPACRVNIDADLYTKTHLRYSNALDSYENHEQIDFDFVKLGLPEDYVVSGWQKFLYHVRYWLTFWLHGALIVTLLFVFGLVLFK